MSNFTNSYDQIVDVSLPSIAEFSVQAKTDTRTRASMNVTTERLQKKIREINRQISGVKSEYLLIRPSGSSFVAPPLTENITKLETVWNSLVPVMLEAIQIAKEDAVEMQGMADTFYASHGKKPRLALTDSYIEKRMAKQMIVHPWQLPEEIRNRLFTPEKLAEWRAAAEDEVGAAIQDKVQTLLGDLVDNVSSAVSQVGKDRIVNKATIKNITQAYDELTKMVPFVPHANGNYQVMLEEFSGLLEQASIAKSNADVDKSAMDVMRDRFLDLERKGQEVIEALQFDVPEPSSYVPPELTQTIPRETAPQDDEEEDDEFVVNIPGASA